MPGRCRILVFHQTADRFFPGINNIRRRPFDHILGLVEDLDFTLREFSAVDQIQDDAAAITMTFDDGYEDNLPAIDTLIERKAAPAVFIPTGYIGKMNDWEYSSRFFGARHLDRSRIRHLAESGVVIGSHGITHRAFTTMPDEVLRKELAGSKSALEDITGLPVDVISFPFGRTNARVNRIARECGYRRGFTLGESPKIPSGGDEGFVIPRIPIYGADNYFSLKGKLTGESSRERLKNRIINMLAAGTIIVRGRLK